MQVLEDHFKNEIKLTRDREVSHLLTMVAWQTALSTINNAIAPLMGLSTAIAITLMNQSIKPEE